jgi:hypothetical protein
VTDLSNMSDADLQALYNSPRRDDVSNMSDSDLQAAYDAHNTSTLGDVAKSAAAGLGNATISTLGLPGTLRSLAGQGVDALGRKLGFDPAPVKDDAYWAAKMVPGLNLLADAPTISDVRASVTDPIVSPDYEPKTGIGSVVKTGAEFLPGVIDPELAGPSLLKAGAKLLATRVAAPALASEAAGALTQGTAAEPWARMGAAVLGGGGATALANGMAERAAIRAATPSLADIKTDASNAYDALTSRNVAVPIAQSDLDDVANDIRTTLNNKGIRPSVADSIHKAIDEIHTPATAGAPDVADLVAARQNIKSLLGSPDANRAGASVALPKIEQAIEQASPGTMANIQEADKNWASMKAGESLDKKIARADLRAAATDSGMNTGNKIRQNVATLLASNEAKFLAADTKAELEKIVRGTATQNVLRHVGNLLGAGGGLGMLAGGAAGYEAGGVPGALTGAALGRLARIVGNRSVVAQAERAGQNIRLRSPLAQQNPPVIPPMTGALRASALSAVPIFVNRKPKK